MTLPLRVDGHEFIRQIKMAPEFIILKDGDKELQLHVKDNQGNVSLFLSPDFSHMTEIAAASFKEEVMETLRNPAIRQNRIM